MGNNVKIISDIRRCSSRGLIRQFVRGKTNISINMNAVVRLPVEITFAIYDELRERQRNAKP